MNLPNLFADPVLLASLGGVLLVLLLLFGLWIRQRRARRPLAQLRAAAQDCLEQFLIHDGEDGEIHIDLALLTATGILVVDLREANGHVFGSNAMQDWTVIGNGRRYTFSNPQQALYDRVAAVSRLLPNVPVSGLVVFGSQADFSKGLPDDVMLVPRLIDQLNVERREAAEGSPSADLGDAWDSLRRAAVDAQVGHLIRS